MRVLNNLKYGTYGDFFQYIIRIKMYAPDMSMSKGKLNALIT